MTDRDECPPPARRERFFARQPVLDMARRLQAYGLFARQTVQGTGCLCADPTAATASVLHEIITSGNWDRLFGNVPAMVTFAGDAVLRGDYETLPPAKLIIKLLSEACDMPGIDGACRRLRHRGYKLAVDSCSHDDACAPLLPVADIITVDFSVVTADRRASVARSLASLPAKRMAMKVESQADYKQAIALGFDYCMGYFFCRPQTLRHCDAGDGQQSLMRLAAALSAPSLDLPLIEEIFRGDPSLSYKLLRYLNSASLGVGHHVTSISHALHMLGERPLRRWAWLVTMASLGEDKPRELTAAALIRARFGETLAESDLASIDASEAFLVGLLSLMEPMVERPLDEVLSDLPVSMPIKAALLGAPTPLGRLVDLAAACERCEPKQFDEAASQLKLTTATVGRCYYNAIAWTSQVLAA